jgi:uncharacterized delta-60 repeat protein
VVQAQTAGSTDAGFNLGIIGSSVSGFAVQGDGKIVVSGLFSSVGGSIRNQIARVNGDGTLDQSFNPDVQGGIKNITVQDDGKIIVGGDLTSVNGVTRNRIARLNSNGTLDTGFNPNPSGGNYPTVSCTALQSDGRILIAGNFTSVGGVTRNRIARLNSDGSLDAGFNPNVDGIIFTATIQADGKIVLGGQFTSVATMTRNRIARVNSDGSLDTGLNPGVSGPTTFTSVYSSAVQADGKIIIGGIFTSVGGSTRNNLARLNPNGTLDAGFNPNVDNNVITVAVQTDGSILIGGDFKNVIGTSQSSFARLDSSGALVNGFNSVIEGGAVYNVALQTDGKILIGGGFTAVGGVPYNRIARLGNSVATQRLSVVGPDRVQWFRGGAAPETLQAVFELSTNGGSSWTPLGPAVRITGGWERTGLNLPSAGLIRARARTAGALYSGSSGVVQSVGSFPGAEIAVERPGIGDFSAGGIVGFGSVLLGSSESQTFQVKNTGTADLTLEVTKDGTNQTDFVISLPASATVAAGEFTTFLATFNPTAAGTRIATFHIKSNDADENPFDIVLTGTGTAPEIEVEQPAGSGLADGGTSGFGTVNLSSSALLTFTIYNSGTGSMSGLAISKNGTNAADFNVSAPGVTTLAAGASKTFTVTFNPAAAGARTAAIQIASNDADENPFDINLTGTGRGVSEIVVEQPAGTGLTDGSAVPLDFGSVISGTSVSQTVTIRNTGTADLMGIVVTLSGGSAAGDYSIWDLGATTLALGTATTFNVFFSPGGPGARTATLLIASNDEDENPFEIALTGSRATPLLDAWRLTYFGSTANSGAAADLSDPDRDGVVNLMEFATGSGPWTANAQPGELVKNGGSLEFTWPRRKAALAEIFYEVEWSESLAGPWSAARVITTIRTDSSVMQEMQSASYTGGIGKRFVRLRVGRL